MHIVLWTKTKLNASFFVNKSNQGMGVIARAFFGISLNLFGSRFGWLLVGRIFFIRKILLLHCSLHARCSFDVLLLFHTFINMEKEFFSLFLYLSVHICCVYVCLAFFLFSDHQILYVSANLFKVIFINNNWRSHIYLNKKINVVC